MPWLQAASIDELRRKPVLLKAPPKQIAVFEVEGRVFAVDNRCPHEGYPLIEGSVDAQGCVLTCNWHNWKFRLSDGKCILGGDHVRSYSIRVEDDQVWVDTDDPPLEVVQREILDGLQTAFKKRDYGRICREISRLHFNGADPILAVQHAVQWSHDRLEFGFTHAFAAAADWLALRRRWSAEHPDDLERQLVCLAEAVDHMAADSLRHPRHPYAEPAASFDSDEFLNAVEREDRIRAEALAAAACENGTPWSELEPVFAQAALDHYNDFGHSLIYVYKTGQWIDLAGAEVQKPLAVALARSLCYTTREDLLPEFSDYAPALARLRTSPAVEASTEPPPAPFPASTKEAIQWLENALAACRVEVVYDRLLEALARNQLAFDTSYQDAYDRPVSDNVGWLDFTHGVTFANAVRNLASRTPELWKPGLLQMACFLGRNRRYLDLQLDHDQWRVDDVESFLPNVYERLLDHGLREPIFAAHLIKTTTAVEEELTAASPSCKRWLAASLNRFLSSPLKQKHARRLARQAIQLVRRDFS